MDIGLFYESTDHAMPVPQVAELAEQRGFESLWLGEHSHMSLAGSASARIGGPREADSHMLDPFVALSAAAGVTRELRLGTGVCLIVQRDTIQTAKTVASLDHISGGRFEFGVGAGREDRLAARPPGSIHTLVPLTGVPRTTVVP